MATPSIRLTYRDMDLFTALERCPLTVRQIQKLSVTFHSSYSSERRLQDRLMLLTRADLLRRYRYAATDAPGRYYYTLSPGSYRLLHGDEPPSGGLFHEVAVARQHHTHRLADFIVHTVIGAHAAGVEVKDFSRENTLKLSTADDHLYPDSAFTLTANQRAPFTFYVELDNSTEPLASPRERDSWRRKLQFYERLQDQSPGRFRVLGIVTKSPKRVSNMLTLAAAVARNPQRSLLYGVFLPEYREEPNPLTAPIFTDHRGLQVALWPSLPATAAPKSKALAADVRM